MPDMRRFLQMKPAPGLVFDHRPLEHQQRGKQQQTDSDANKGRHARFIPARHQKQRGYHAAQV